MYLKKYLVYAKIEGYMREIKKINDIEITEGFLQINLVKGYKYIDKAGEIVNYFHKEDGTPPKFTMDLSGLIIPNLDDKIDTLKISSNQFWANFKFPGSIEYMADNFSSKIKDVLNILEVSTIDRIGWRNYFVYEFKDEATREAVLQKFSVGDSLKLEQIMYSKEINGFNLNIQILKILTKESLPGILIDIDTYKKDKVNSETVKSELNKFKDLYRSKEFIELINLIIK